MVGSGAARLTALDGVMVGAGLLAYISSFLPWYTTSVSVLGINRSASADAWHAGVGAWCSVLLLVLVGVLVLVGTLGGLGASASRSLITLGLSVLAFIALILRWVTFPDASGGLSRSDELGGLDLGSAFTVSSGAGVGLYLGLIATIVAVVASLLTLRAVGRTVTS
jgi:hypothetical protein